MSKKGKTYAIYCSDGASRVIGFYSFKVNLEKYRPHKVIYDGDKEEIIKILKELFQNDLIVFNKYFASFDPLRIHSSTSKFIHNICDKYSIEYLLCFGNKILKDSFLREYSNKLINFHPALLPSFKGLLSIDQALEYGVALIGNTVHYIDEGIDTGRIILQTAMLSEEFEDYENVLEMQFPMMKMVFRDILNFDISEDDIMKEIPHREKKILIPKKCKI